MASVSTSNEPPVSTFPSASSSITIVGGTRPPRPITTGVGTGDPFGTTSTVSATISVTVRLAKSRSLGGQLTAQPGRNSLTVPDTVTLSPTATGGTAFVKTKMPSEVRSSASGIGSCMVNPLWRTAVTTPGTLVTAIPA